MPHTETIRCPYVGGRYVHRCATRTEISVCRCTLSLGAKRFCPPTRLPCWRYRDCLSRCAHVGLGPVSPTWLRPVFTSVFRQLQRGKALEAMTFLDGHYLLALDGTGYFSSKTIHCASCLHKVHRNGSITYYHQMLGAAIIHPDW